MVISLIASSRRRNKVFPLGLRKGEVMKAFITVGIPGSGKTYWATNQVAQNGGVNVNLDDCRHAVSGDATNQACTPQAVALHTALVDAVIGQGVPLYVSDTNLHPQFREALISKLTAAGYAVNLVVFNTPHDVCRARNLVRTNPVPDHAMGRMQVAFDSFMEQVPDGALVIG
jgi:predicted kinase